MQKLREPHDVTTLQSRSCLQILLDSPQNWSFWNRESCWRPWIRFFGALTRLLKSNSDVDLMLENLISSGLQTLQLFDSGFVEYSPFEISQREQMPPGALENFPGSHAWQVRAPSELVFPGGQSSQISDGGSVPVVPATHGSEAEQTWLVALQRESLHPRATGIVVDPSPATTEPALARLQDVPSLLL